MAEYKDLFIDFDDTLYDTHGNAIIALRELYEAFNMKEKLSLEEKFYEEYWKANVELWGQYSRGEIERDYLIVERFRRPLAACAYSTEGWLTKEYCLQVSDKFLDLCSVKPGVVEGAHELVKYLKASGYKMHICSNGFHEVQYKKLRACGLIDYFDSIILSEDAGVNKPSPKFFDYAFKVSGAQRETTLMIGDNYNSDIIGAINSGIDTMLFMRWDPIDMPKQPKYQVATLKEITTIL